MKIYIAILYSVLLPSCLNTSTFDFKTAVTTDHRYEQLIKLAETAPSPDAIFGLWHRKEKSHILLGSSHWTLLIRSDGGMVWRSIPAGAEERYATIMNTPAVYWHYRGDGVWELLDSTDKVRPTIRISGQYLLFETALTKHVYTRVE